MDFMGSLCSMIPMGYMIFHEIKAKQRLSNLVGQHAWPKSWSQAWQDGWSKSCLAGWQSMDFMDSMHSMDSDSMDLMDYMVFH